MRTAMCTAISIRYSNVTSQQRFPEGRLAAGDHGAAWADHTFRPVRMSGADGLRGGLGLDQNLLGEKGRQLAGLEHLGNDGATPDEFALDVELRHGRPVRELLDAVAQSRVFEHIRGLERHV